MRTHKPRRTPTAPQSMHTRARLSERRSCQPTHASEPRSAPTRLLLRTDDEHVHEHEGVRDVTGSSGSRMRGLYGGSALPGWKLSSRRFCSSPSRVAAEPLGHFFLTIGNLIADGLLVPDPATQKTVTGRRISPSLSNGTGDRTNRLFTNNFVTYPFGHLTDSAGHGSVLIGMTAPSATLGVHELRHVRAPPPRIIPSPPLSIPSLHLRLRDRLYGGIHPHLLPLSSKSPSLRLLLGPLRSIAVHCRGASDGDKNERQGSRLHEAHAYTYIT